MSAFVQGASHRAAASVAACAFPAANTAGNCLVVLAIAAEPFGGLTTMTIADSQGNAWTHITSPAEQNNILPGVWIAPNCKAGANTVTVTYNYGSYPIMCVVLELTGILAVSPLDVQNAAAATSATHRSVAATTTHTNDVLLLLALDAATGAAVETNTLSWPVVFSVVDSGTYPAFAFTVSESFAAAAGAQSNDGWGTCSYGNLYLLALQGVAPPAAAPPVWPAMTFAGGVKGIAYSQDWDLAPASTPTTYTLISGSLPTGLVLTNVSGDIGRLSGTPTVINTFTFTLRASNSAGAADKAFSITIANPASAITFPPAYDVYYNVDRGDGVLGTLRASTIGTAAGGASVTAGNLRFGVTIDDVAGSLALPTAAQVLAPIQFGANGTQYTGTLAAGGTHVSGWML